MICFGEIIQKGTVVHVLCHVLLCGNHGYYVVTMLTRSEVSSGVKNSYHDHLKNDLLMW